MLVLEDLLTGYVKEKYLSKYIIDMKCEMELRERLDKVHEELKEVMISRDVIYKDGVCLLTAVHDTETYIESTSYFVVIGNYSNFKTKSNTWSKHIYSSINIRDDNKPYIVEMEERLVYVNANSIATDKHIIDDDDREYNEFDDEE